MISRTNRTFEIKLLLKLLEDQLDVGKHSEQNFSLGRITYIISR